MIVIDLLQSAQNFQKYGLSSRFTDQKWVVIGR